MYDLGLRPHWTYETLVSTYRGEVPHAAPLGIRIVGRDRFSLHVYEGSRTLKNLLASGDFTVGFPQDATHFQTVLLHPEQLAFVRGKHVHAPVLLGTAGTIEARVRESRRGEDETTFFEAEAISIAGNGEVRPINRADPLLLEAVILLTRAEILGPEEVSVRLMEAGRVIAKVAPGSAHAAAIRELIDHLKAR
ncbi:MAG: hypothetical protein Kow00129_11170 [Thermoleophilia bacterium]